LTEKDQFEIQLLKAKVKQIEKENSKSLLREAMPSIWAIAFSIIASIIVIWVGDRVYAHRVFGGVAST
jgi:hypothetical protein